MCFIRALVTLEHLVHLVVLSLNVSVQIVPKDSGVGAPITLVHFVTLLCMHSLDMCPEGIWTLCCIGTLLTFENFVHSCMGVLDVPLQVS